MDLLDELNTVLLLITAAGGGLAVYLLTKMLRLSRGVAADLRRALAMPAAGSSPGASARGSAQPSVSNELSSPGGTGAWPLISELGVLEDEIKIELQDDSSILDFLSELLCGLESIAYLISNRNKSDAESVAPRVGLEERAALTARPSRIAGVARDALQSTDQGQ